MGTRDTTKSFFERIGTEKVPILLVWFLDGRKGNRTVTTQKSTLMYLVSARRSSSVPSREEKERYLIPNNTTFRLPLDLSCFCDSH